MQHRLHGIARFLGALSQAALGQELGEKDAPAVGKLAGADSLVLGQVADGATSFIVTVRVVDATSGDVIGAGSSSLPRNDVVARADVETRTPGEAAFRSAIAPGWGQAYNGQGVKAIAFGRSSLPPTSSTSCDCRAGESKALTMPSTRLATISCQG